MTKGKNTRVREDCVRLGAGMTFQGGGVLRWER